ncbi:hypothetical protein ABOC32_16815 [Pseudomonas sp. WOUb67]|uniref:hypothetical protein n=1 Tax=Pseudomonas sp. WOUb67 TaxID=3161136 RepID=UPI003CF37532
MAYNSAHSGPEIDAAVEMLSQVQHARDSTKQDLAEVKILAGEVRLNARQVAANTAIVEEKAAQVVSIADAVEQARVEVEAATLAAEASKDAAALSASSAQQSQEAASASEHAAGQSQLAAGVSEQVSAESADIAVTAAEQSSAERVLAQVSAESARISAENAQAVVTGGTATVNPEPGKIPLADYRGKIDQDWLPDEIARSATVEVVAEAASSAVDIASEAAARTQSFLQPSPEPPVLRDDGLPLQIGDRYTNTVEQAEYIYKQGGWALNDSLVAFEELRVETEQIKADQVKPLANYDDLNTFTHQSALVMITDDEQYGIFKRRIGDTVSDLVPGMVLQDGAGVRYFRLFENRVRAEWFGAVGDGVTDDFPALSAMAAFCRNNRVACEFESKTYYTTGDLDPAGLQLKGAGTGYQGRKGTILKGSGANKVIRQALTGLDFVTFSIENLQIADAALGMSFAYAVHGRVDNVWIVNCTKGLEVGQAGVLGPLWCKFTNVHVYANGGLALDIQGTDFANADMFDTCTFHSTGVFVGRIGTSSGFGAVAINFLNSEVYGSGGGIELIRTMSVNFHNGYWETFSPPICINGNSVGVSFTGANTWGGLRASNPTGKKGFIHHKSGSCTLSSSGGTIALNAGEEYNDLRYIVSDSPSTLTIRMMDPPARQVASTGFRNFGEGLPTSLCTVSHQDIYTPELYIGGVSTSVGNGTLTGAITFAGRSATVVGVLTIGSSTVLPAGVIQITVPIAERAADAERAMGICRIFDNGVGSYVGACELVTGSDKLTFYPGGGSPNAVQNNAPMVWAAGDVLRFSITYNF